MDSKDKLINELSSVMLSLSQELESLQIKIEQLCKSTENYGRAGKTPQDFIPKKEVNNGINIDAFREKE